MVGETVLILAYFGYEIDPRRNRYLNWSPGTLDTSLGTLSPLLDPQK